jgi:ATP/maltotriose-dependent transcriptional regulator MalT
VHRAQIMQIQGAWPDALDALRQAYRQAAGFGRDPQPGLALLRLTQGQLDAAAAGIRRALDETTVRFRRPRLLSAAVEIALEGDDVEAARAAAEELSQLGAERDVPLLNAMAAQAGGLVRLAEGDARMELDAARQVFERLSAGPDLARVVGLTGVARHLSNIFTKLGVSSRAAATAYAFQHDLV